MGNVVSAVVSLGALCALGYLIYERGFVGAFDALRSALYGVFDRPFAVLMHGRPQAVVAPAPLPLTDAQEKRLQEIADVPLEDIIAAAERRALHPDDPIPAVLADLDPDTRHKPRPQLAVLSPGMDFKVGTVTVLRDINRKIDAEVKGRYDDCTHPDAEREEVMGWSSTRPTRTLITSCLKCDLIAAMRRRLSVLVAELEALVGVVHVDSGRGRDQYLLAMAEADAIKQALNNLLAEEEIRQQVGG